MLGGERKEGKGKVDNEGRFKERRKERWSGRKGKGKQQLRDNGNRKEGKRMNE